MITDKKINCPRCSTFFKKYKMRLVPHPKGIMLDVCDNCHGIWIDGHEVEIMFEKSGKEDKPAKKKHKTKK